MRIYIKKGNFLVNISNYLKISILKLYLAQRKQEGNMGRFVKRRGRE